MPARLPPGADLLEWFDNIDIYLFDQILKGRVRPGTRLLDAGCGHGRNLVYFLRTGYDVYAVDQSSQAIDEVRGLASRLAPHLTADRFRVEPVEGLSFPDATFDVVISSAVLHFALDEAHFETMVSEMWRVLRPGGMLFARLASSIGIESLIQPLSGRRASLPDGTDRFLVDEAMLRRMADQLGGQFLEPIKTVNVEHQRCMTTWCLSKVC